MGLRLKGQTTGYVELEAPASAADNTLTLPNGNGTNGQVLTTNGSGTLSFTTVGPFLASSDIGSTVQAFDADTAKTDAVQLYTASQRGEVTTLTDAANISVDFAASNNFTLTLAGNRVLNNPTNLVAGQSGVIYIKQDSTGSRTLSYGSAWSFAAGTPPVLSTAASSLDAIAYSVESSSNIVASAILNIS